jgi:hypothetical protein
MTVRVVRFVGAALLAGAATVFLVGGPAYAAACSTTAPGVTVVVDFASLGGGDQVACAAGDPATGLAALHGAGFGTTGTQRFGSAFVCRIDGKPASDPCVDTPPASAYWSYWHAQPGGRWVSSTDGATSSNPSPGTVEGWAFGSGSPPGLRPPQLITPPAPPAPPPPVPPPAHPTTHPATHGPIAAPPVATVEPSTIVETPATVPVPSSTVDPLVDPTGASPSVAAPAPSGGTGGVPLGTIAGIAVVVLLAGAAGTFALLRRLRPPAFALAITPDPSADPASPVPLFDPYPPASPGLLFDPHPPAGPVPTADPYPPAGPVPTVDPYPPAVDPPASPDPPAAGAPASPNPTVDTEPPGGPPPDATPEDVDFS